MWTSGNTLRSAEIDNPEKDDDEEAIIIPKVGDLAIGPSNGDLAIGPNKGD
jgi:hypothetical protein